MATFELEVEDYKEPEKAPHELRPVVEQLAALGEGKIGVLRFPTADASEKGAEADARGVLKGLQTAAREIDRGVRLHSLTAEGKGKDAVVVLRWKIGKKFTRQRSTAQTESE